MTSTFNFLPCNNCFFLPLQLHRSFLFFRVAGNAAYFIGTLAEMDLAKNRVVDICIQRKALMVLPRLTDMLAFEDMETVMNAAGTLGTLV